VGLPRERNLWYPFDMMLCDLHTCFGCGVADKETLNSVGDSSQACSLESLILVNITACINTVRCQIEPSDFAELLS
jgi:hypothetical protein